MTLHLARFTLLAWLAGFALSCMATVPTILPYQGFLANAGGEPVSGSRDVHFALYDQASGGVALWTETHAGVAVTAGFFQVELGSAQALADVLFDAPLFLGVTIDAEVEMTPRMRIGSVPFARASGALLACASGETNCNGACADLQSDVDHCGTCGSSCGLGEVCLLGTCDSCTPQTLYRDDDGDGWGQCDDAVQTCSAAGAYTASQCGDCDDAQSDINPDAAEACGDGVDNNCNGFTDCADLGCPGGGSASLTYCNGSCVDTESDIDHCSTCGAACAGGSQCADPVCIGGSCGLDGGSFQGNACDDQNACTASDTCDTGSCTGTPIDCDDGEQCTVDSCDSLTGCNFEPVADGTPCTGGTCNSGVCTP